MKLFVLLLFLVNSAIYAENKVISPADLTQVKTFLWAQTGNENSTLSGGFSGNLTSSMNYLALLQYTRSYDRDEEQNDNLRFRLFGVDKVDFGVIDSIGISIDYININENISIKKSQMIAYGAIVKIDTGFAWLDIFPNIAYVTSKTTLKDNEEIKAYGYQLNIFASIYLDTAGKYLMLLPQYTNTTYTENKKMEVEYGQPLSDDMRLWFNTTISYEEETLNYNGVEKNLDAVKTVKLGVIYYF